MHIVKFTPEIEERFGVEFFILQMVFIFPDLFELITAAWMIYFLVMLALF